MLIVAFLLVLMSAKSAQKDRNHTNIVICSGLIFNDTYYNRDIIYPGAGRSLFMHQPSGDLFFSSTVRDTSMSSRLLACHVDTKSCREIQGINGGFTVGFDVKYNKIYFGGIDGIYIYNNVTDAAEYFAEEGNSIWGLFIRNNFYYIEYPSQRLYRKKGDRFVKSAIEAEVLTFYASQSRMYYSNRSGVYSMEKSATAIPTALSTQLLVRQITEDISGDIYFCANDGIYVENRGEFTLRKMADIVEAFGMAFITGNIDGVPTSQVIYSDEFNIFKLVSTPHSEICYNAIMSAEEKLRQSKPATVYLDLRLDLL